MKKAFRPEIQGLRSLAVLMVVAYHVWFGRVSGGVDVFLMISAFLMTLQFTNKFDRKTPVDLLRHWLHLFRRLLPASAVVIAATLLATFLFVPKTRWTAIIEQGWASLLYYQNFLLKAQAVDYYAADHSQASPFQHFWSLSIQGQIFILWPLIFVAAALLARAFRLRYRGLLLYIFGTVFAASLTFSVYYTATNQAQAYFDTGARLWEFALGSLVALVLPALNLPRRMRVWLGWTGVAAMLACGLVLNVETAFPGFIALWPILAASAVIVAGQTGSRYGVDRLLSSGPLVKLGDNSFALYLWHWPVLVIYLIWSGKDHAGWLSGTAVVAASLLLAVLTTRFIEKPWRQWAWPDARRRRAIIAVLAAGTIAVVPLSGWKYVLDQENRALILKAEQNNPGSKALDPGFIDKADTDAGVLPAADRLSKDFALLDGRCEGPLAPGPGLLEKACGQTKGLEKPAKKILVLGNSHAEQWMAALAPVAKKNNWLLYYVLKGGCVYAPPASGLEADCEAFNRKVDKYIAQQKPDAIVTVATAASPSSPAERLAPGFEQLARQFTADGIDVVGIRDNPRFIQNMADCVMSKGADDPACNPPRESVLPETPAFSPLIGKIAGLSLLDMTDRLCTETSCRAQVGNMFVYLDEHHLSATYARTMADVLESRLLAATGWH
ncbi:UNVERIFIED_ORG: peptidoglycan/LPS O-acetylase OafA/YrhL [Arthrobacter globiformis]|nr:peptidoglycan/LPS O-acetylase OafA/YrhL [Arthrobacter globiformis]